MGRVGEGVRRKGEEKQGLVFESFDLEREAGEECAQVRLEV